MQKFLISVLAVIALVQFSSCAALSRWKCSREYAAKKGMDDAENGRTSMPGRLEGSVCDSGGDYAASDFSKDYNYGYGKKKDEVCVPATAAAWGRGDGEAGAGSRPSKTKLRLCDDRGLAKLEALYEKEYTKAFCAPARAEKLGKERAESFQAADFETSFQDCKTNGKGLKASYLHAYQDTMRGACTVSRAMASGESEARAGHGLDSMRDRLQACGGNKAEIMAAFEKSYSSTKATMAKEEADKKAAADEADRKAKMDAFLRNTATADFAYAGRIYYTHCQVAGDKSYVVIDVQNNYPEQVLIEGFFRVSYFGADFQKITEDRTQEAVLVSGNNRKAFQKMTLPRDATYCRADFVGQ